MKAESRIEAAKKALFDEAVAKLKEKATNYHEILQALRFALDGSVAPSFKKSFCKMLFTQIKYLTYFNNI